MKSLIVAAFAALCLSIPALAAECEFPFDETVGGLSAAGAPVVIIEPADLPALVDKVEAIDGKELGEVTRGFFAQAGGKILLGLEVDGCLLPPIVLGLAPAADKLSGRDESGKIGA